jgi:hypothetical protein
MTTSGREPGGTEPQGRGAGTSGDGARRPGWAAVSLLLIAACAAGLGFAAGSRAATAADAADLAGPGLGQELEAGCGLELPPGHPLVGGGLLPPGHPPIGDGLLPPGHPPIGDGLLPPGHPPIGGLPRLPAGHPPVPRMPAPIRLLEPPATFTI